MLDDLMINEGLSNVFARHQVIAEFVRKSLTEIGYRLSRNRKRFNHRLLRPSMFPPIELLKLLINSSSLWNGYRRKLWKNCRKGLPFGNMGTQATMTNARSAIDVLRQVI
jgi:hypothetical protein